MDMPGGGVLIFWRKTPPEPEVNCSLPSNAEVKYGWSCTSVPPYVLSLHGQEIYLYLYHMWRADKSLCFWTCPTFLFVYWIHLVVVIALWSSFIVSNINENKKDLPGGVTRRDVLSYITFQRFLYELNVLRSTEKKEWFSAHLKWCTYSFKHFLRLTYLWLKPPTNSVT